MAAPIRHPAWCDRVWCTVTANGSGVEHGMHSSRPSEVATGAFVARSRLVAMPEIAGIPGSHRPLVHVDLIDPQRQLSEPGELAGFVTGFSAIPAAARRLGGRLVELADRAEAAQQQTSTEAPRGQE